MKTSPPISRWLCVLLLGLAIGCCPTGPRCAKCGMLVDDHPRWVAGAITAAGIEQRFCSPRCLFAWHLGPHGTGSHDLWVTEYYSQERTPATNVLFVLGSDVTGPMGKALVPVAGPGAAERFRADHHGSRLLHAGDITPELLREIAGKPPEPDRP